MEVYVAVQGSDAGDEVLGVYATPDLAIMALKEHSYRGSSETHASVGFSARRRQEYWYLVNRHEIDQPASRRFVGVVTPFRVQGGGQ